MGKSGCELPPPARISGPREVKISLSERLTQGAARRACKSLENVLMCSKFFWWSCCGVRFFVLICFGFLFVCLFLLLVAFLRIVFYRSIVLLEVMITRRGPLENACWAYCSASSLQASGQIFVSSGFHSSRYSDLGFGNSIHQKYYQKYPTPKAGGLEQGDL